jgi:uncharacterized protein (DUF1800 family)
MTHSGVSILSWRKPAVLTLFLLLAACGGGGGGGKPPITTMPPADAPPTQVELAEAARFANRASFGLSFEEIQNIVRDGPAKWLDAQFALPVGLHSSTVDELLARREAGEFAEFEEDIEYLVQFRRFAWWNCAVTCEDVLRQRVAFALSQIFVVSDHVDSLIVYPYALSNYYDTLLNNAFGNFRDLLRDVALHPAMGVYLSHVNNNRADPLANRFPDENFAREVMQLFTIGLFELNLDGSLRLDDSDQPIPTYDNADIREFAKIFTGFSFAGANAFFGRRIPFYRAPMRMFDANHEPGEKQLLGGTLVPAGQTGMEDFEAAIDVLFNHPNVGPFIGKQLIQRLVTSNPSPQYIERVARAFNGENGNERGNMRALLEAVLNDSEAMASNNPQQHFGRLREPVLRYLNLLRVFGADSDDHFIADNGYILQELGRQHPLSAPSVFNFFLPTHSPPGEIAAAGLVAPEFQIVNSSSVVNMINILDLLLFGEEAIDTVAPFAPVTLALDEITTLAGDLDGFLDRLDILLTHGSMSSETRDVIRNVLLDIADNDLRARLGIYMVMMSADYVVEL